ncbi:MAG TPA: hypothetical protein VFQ06_09130 [Nitrospira sp.]|nr:hypothetical protein [Nitrospira sp.]
MPRLSNKALRAREARQHRYTPADAETAVSLLSLLRGVGDRRAVAVAKRAIVQVKGTRDDG